MIKDLPVLNMKMLMNQIDSTISSIAKTKNSIIVLGSSKVGKTTIIQEMLKNYNIDKIKRQQTQTQCWQINKEYKIWILNGQQINKTISQNIINSYKAKNIIKNSENIKIIFCVSQSQINSDRYRLLIQSLRFLSKFFSSIQSNEQINNIIKNIIFVINKINECEMDQKQLQESFKEQFQNIFNQNKSLQPFLSKFFQFFSSQQSNILLGMKKSSSSSNDSIGIKLKNALSKINYIKISDISASLTNGSIKSLYQTIQSNKNIIKQDMNSILSKIRIFLSQIDEIKVLSLEQKIIKQLQKFLIISQFIRNLLTFKNEYSKNQDNILQCFINQVNSIKKILSNSGQSIVNVNYQFIFQQIIRCYICLQIKKKIILKDFISNQFNQISQEIYKKQIYLQKTITQQLNKQTDNISSDLIYFLNNSQQLKEFKKFTIKNQSFHEQKIIKFLQKIQQKSSYQINNYINKILVINNLKKKHNNIKIKFDRLIQIFIRIFQSSKQKQNKQEIQNMRNLKNQQNKKKEQKQNFLFQDNYQRQKLIDNPHYNQNQIKDINFLSIKEKQIHQYQFQNQITQKKMVNNSKIIIQNNQIKKLSPKYNFNQQYKDQQQIQLKEQLIKNEKKSTQRLQSDKSDKFIQTQIQQNFDDRIFYVKGSFIQISQIKHKLNIFIQKVKQKQSQFSIRSIFLKVFATNQIIIDSNIQCQNLNIIIVGSKITVKGNILFNIQGSKGQDANQPIIKYTNEEILRNAWMIADDKQSTKFNYQKYINGVDGKMGCKGQKGGIMYLFAKQYNLNNGQLNVNVSGGNGGNGTNGTQGFSWDKQYQKFGFIFTSFKKLYGGHGGHGGKGGQSGNSGDCVAYSLTDLNIITKSLKKIQVISQMGTAGKHGKGGKGGVGGQLKILLLKRFEPIQLYHGSNGKDGFVSKKSKKYDTQILWNTIMKKQYIVQQYNCFINENK